MSECQGISVCRPTSLEWQLTPTLLALLAQLPSMGKHLAFSVRRQRAMQTLRCQRMQALLPLAMRGQHPQAGAAAVDMADNCSCPAGCSWHPWSADSYPMPTSTPASRFSPELIQMLGISRLAQHKWRVHPGPTACPAVQTGCGLQRRCKEGCLTAPGSLLGTLQHA